MAIGITSLAIAAAVTLVSMFQGAAWKLEWSSFYPWALRPYIVLAIVFTAVRKGSRATQIATLVAGATVLLFTCLIYVDAMFVHVNSTSALVFVFVPLYLLMGGTIVFVVAALLGNKFVGAK